VEQIDVIELKGSLRGHRLLDTYCNRVLTECPGLPDALLRTWSTSSTDAVLIRELLDAYRSPVDVLDVGTFLGTSAFLFASHPQVERVVTIDPNPYVADEVNEKQDALGAYLDPHVLEGVRVQDVARACLEGFPELAAKVQFVEGGLRGTLEPGDTSVDFDVFDLADLELQEQQKPLVVLVDGLHTADGVYGDVTTVFSARRDAIVLLDDCRYFWGPFVQAGIGRFLSEHPSEFQFHLFADLSPSLAGSALAVLHSSEHGALPEAVGALVSSLSIWFDPLQLLQREQEVVASASAVFERESSLSGSPAELAKRRLEQEVSYLRRISAESHRQMNVMGRQLESATSELNAAREEMASLRRTASWKMTKPMRRIRAHLPR
jgi:hypothetical protein